ncbi:MAG: hypothetical protein CMK59_13835 [Proteobacteria bacterium]|nr:hypothetical protein [Pseudomonadota bacterium]
MNYKTLLAVSFLLTACIPSAKDDTSSNTIAEASSEPSSDASEPTSEPTSEPSAGTSNCTDMSSQECFECFAMEDQAGYQAYVNALVGNCYCANDCEASCTDFCSDPSLQTPPSADCDSCVNGVISDQSSACIQGFSADCQADATCINFAMAVQECPQ